MLKLLSRIRKLVRGERAEPSPTVPPPLSPRLKIWADRGEPSYDENSLVTWQQSLDFLTSPRFRAAYARGMDSDHQIMRPPGSREDIHIE
jgi:hypothetical protein